MLHHLTSIKITLVLAACLVLLGMPLTASAEDDESTSGTNEQKSEKESSKKTEKDKPKDKKKDKKKKTIKELVKKSALIDGLFSIYRDKKTGETRLLIKQEQLDKEFLYFTYIENGVAAAGWGRTRGSYHTYAAKLFKVHRYYDRLEFVEYNTSYYFDPKKAISRAADANISPAVIFSEKIEAEDKKSGNLLIKADKLFLTEAFYPYKPIPQGKQKKDEGFKLGKLSKEKSKIRNVRNYPKNTDIIVEYIYENSAPKNDGGAEVTDPRYITLVAQHTLMEAPETPMAPRFDDPRMGYFTHEVTDLSSTELLPYRDMIRRFRLEKKHPTAELSEPVKPITFWLENTTPEEIRPIIKAAALQWNIAFEKAGFKNAVVVKIQPDDADWQAGDMRYNVIRWVSSPSRFYSGYGPSFIDPRSGEVLGADIMLEHAVITDQILTQQILGAGSLASSTENTCNVAAEAHNNLLYGMTSLRALGANSAEQQRMLEEFLYFLTLHEIGHTLGLTHNFRSSHLHSLVDIFNPEKTYAEGLLGSVMDYPAVAFNANNSDETNYQFWTKKPGPYDLWAIEYGYSLAQAGEKIEQERLNAILTRSTEPELAYANDGADMRAPGKGIDPRVNIWDLSSDPIGFSEMQIEHVNYIQEKLATKLLVEGESYEKLLIGHRVSSYRLGRASSTLARFIGGVYVDRSMVGQPGATAPLTPVPEDDQRRALSIIEKYVFAPNAFDNFNVHANKLLPQRRGFSHYSKTEDPKLHKMVWAIQKDMLNQFMHRDLVERLLDSVHYGNTYSLVDFYEELTAAIFSADLKSEVNTYRQNLQLGYVQRLLDMLNNSKFSPTAQSVALDRLRWIDKAMAKNKRGNTATKAHRQHVRYKIEKGLDLS